jgi:hypothetical protein
MGDAECPSLVGNALNVVPHGPGGEWVQQGPKPLLGCTRDLDVHLCTAHHIDPTFHAPAAINIQSPPNPYAPLQPCPLPAPPPSFAAPALCSASSETLFALLDWSGVSWQALRLSLRARPTSTTTRADWHTNLYSSPPSLARPTA